MGLDSSDEHPPTYDNQVLGCGADETLSDIRAFVGLLASSRDYRSRSLHKGLRANRYYEIAGPV